MRSIGREYARYVLFHTSKRPNQWFWKRARRIVRKHFFTRRSHA